MPTSPSGIDPHIFRAYDIRGKALTQLTEDACEKIGRAFGTVLRRRYKKERPTVLLGRDMRTHSGQLESLVQRGLLASGCHVLSMGQTPSPVNYFTICERGLDGGVQITASHNPAEDNGVKLQVREAEAFAGEDIQELRRMIEKEDFMSGEGSTEVLDAIGPYIERLATLFAGSGEGMRVVVDSGNGVTGPVYTEILRRVGVEVIELYTEPDGTFPNHPADPSKHETLRELQERVVEEKAHIGFGFDGDGDRVGVVDEKGHIRSADEVLLLLAKDHLSRHPSAPIIYTVSMSGILESEIKKWGGKPVVCKVGHSFVEHAMRENGALLGGEQSGHFFAAENYYPFDDAIVAALRVLQIAHRSQSASLSKFLSEFPRVFTAPELRPHCPDNVKGRIVQAVTEHFGKRYPVTTLDGVRIDFGDGAWAGIRQSNTSPRLSICMEARSEEKLKDIRAIVLEHMKTYREVQF
jgi:phosphomannomutase/phosphoglucomutase